MGYLKTSAIFGPKNDLCFEAVFWPILGKKKTRLSLQDNYIYAMIRLSTLVNDNKAQTSMDTNDNELTRH